MYRWIALPLLLPLAACFGGTYQPDVYFAVEPAPAVTPAAEPSPHTLGIRGLEAPVMLRRPMVYRDGDYRLKTYDGALWAEEPARMLTHALTNAIRESNRFADTAPAGTMRMPDYLLTGSLERFEEVRDGLEAAAVCAVRVEVRHRDTGSLLYGASLEARVPMDGTSHEAYAAAMSQAVTQVVTQAVEGIAAAG